MCAVGEQVQRLRPGSWSLSADVPRPHGECGACPPQVLGGPSTLSPVPHWAHACCPMPPGRLWLQQGLACGSLLSGAAAAWNVPFTGNDVAMIQEAHVGIGLSGKEGLQAARAADFRWALVVRAFVRACVCMFVLSKGIRNVLFHKF